MGNFCVLVISNTTPDAGCKQKESVELQYMIFGKQDTIRNEKKS